jgi:DNA-binding IscR family transcriptional regulator
MPAAFGALVSLGRQRRGELLAERDLRRFANLSPELVFDVLTKLQNRG